MLDLYKNDQNGKYTCTLSIDGDNQNNSTGNGILTIEEKTEYRKIELLKLKLKAANDIILKKYLSDISKNYKEKYESINQLYNDLKLQFESLQNENNILKDSHQKLQNEHKVLMDNLLNEKKEEINSIKEKNIKDNKKQLQDLENSKNVIINDLEKGYGFFVSAHCPVRKVSAEKMQVPT
jgi:FtsZ-binding cell division protein ZapB